MKVVLFEDVKSLGKKDDIVEVSDGYARNFIFKKKLGAEATPKVLNDLKLKKKNDEKVAAEKLSDAKAMAEDIASKQIEVSIKAGQDGRAFGAVSTKEIAVAARMQLGLELDKHKIVLKEPIKSLGTYNVPIKLHPQVVAELKVVVKDKG
ncbi:MAG TPA: 50S ribosomal protein L9 [Lachnospiraceae bacterium]|nr:50S ribosomal protein L9 [Lachnospiraceae bacterium]